MRIACVGQPDLTWGGGWDKKGMKGCGKEKRWGSGVTRPDTELAQKMFFFLPPRYSGAPLEARMDLKWNFTEKFILKL